LNRDRWADASPGSSSPPCIRAYPYPLVRTACRAAFSLTDVPGQDRILKLFLQQFFTSRTKTPAFPSEEGDMAQKGTDAGSSKAKLLDVAPRLLRHKNYRSTSMRDIAKACGCKAASIYKFIPTKESNLFDFLKEETADIVDLTRPLEGDTVTDPLGDIEKKACQRRLKLIQDKNCLKHSSPCQRFSPTTNEGEGFNERRW